MDAKATGKDIVLALLDNMRESSEPLLYNTLVPSHYDVYLHRDDYSRLSGILPRIRDESIQALNAELESLNKKGFSRLAGLKKASRYEPAGKDWAVKFHVDENEELEPGDILIDSRLALPSPMELGAGTKTQRSETIRSGGETRKLRKFQEEGKQEGSAASLAKLTYKDKDGHEHEFLMTSQEISVGRGGRKEFCDLELDGPADISRQHFYLRQDPDTKEFFIQDVSKFGTSVNGKKLAPKEWLCLPAEATITLADIMAVGFRKL